MEPSALFWVSILSCFARLSESVRASETCGISQALADRRGCNVRPASRSAQAGGQNADFRCGLLIEGHHGGAVSEGARERRELLYEQSTSRSLNYGTITGTVRVWYMTKECEGYRNTEGS